MMVLGPTMIVLLFIVAFILWIKFLSNNKTVKVIREEQLYNRNNETRNDTLIVVDQRAAVKRNETRLREQDEEELDRDYGIV
jgi:hypothetical protein